MKRFSQILLLMLLSISISSAQSAQIKNYAELMSALTSGENVRTVIHYGLTKMIIDGKEEKAPDAVGGMKFDTWEFFEKGSVRNEKAYVTTSESVLIGHSYYGYVFNYAKLRIYEDNKVEIIARYLDPNTFEVKMDETFYSEINDGNTGAVYLYK